MSLMMNMILHTSKLYRFSLLSFSFSLSLQALYFYTFVGSGLILFSFRYAYNKSSHTLYNDIKSV